MKKIGLLLVAILFALSPLAFGATTKTVSATVTWDGKDSTGVTEPSVPVTIKLYQDGTTPTVVSSLALSAAATNATMPSFTISVADNGTSTFTFYATATDSAGNVSGKSTSVTLTISGADTIPPGTPVIKLQLN